MTTENRRLGGEGDRRDGVTDDSTDRSRPNRRDYATRPPVRSLTIALDHLDDAGLCCCWTSPDPRRCLRWSR
jgi:hypothetical protein